MSFSAFPEVASECGINSDLELRRIGVDPAVLNDPDAMIPVAPMRDLLDDLAIRYGIPDLGLRLAERRKPSNLGLIALLLREEPTLHHALRSLRRFIRLHFQSLRLELRDFGDATMLEFHFLGSGGAGRQGTEMVLGSLLHIIRTITAGNTAPECVHFVHTRPPDTRAHARFFGSTIAFGQERYGLLLARTLMDQALPRAGAMSTDWLRERLDAMMRTLPLDPVESAEQIVQQLLPTGQCSAERVAAALNMSHRSLRRKLAERGVSFGDLVDQARCQLVRDCLDDNGRSIDEVSSLLGFSQQSAFARWHRTRFGVPPRVARRQRAA